VAFKVNFFFTGSLGSGWTETWYNNGVDYTQTLLQANQLGTLRQGLAGVGSVLKEIRVSDDNITGDSLTDVSGNNLFFEKTEQTDVPFVSALVSMSAGTLYRRSLQIRGVPDQLKVTASFGVASLSGTEALSELLGRADSALYNAKRAGRDRVRLSYQHVTAAAISGVDSTNSRKYLCFGVIFRTSLAKNRNGRNGDPTR